MTTPTKKQNIFEKIIARVDTFQRRHTWIALPYAITKKFGDDGGGHLAALMTYYGFLSLFPLLIVATAFAQIVSQGDTEMKDRIISGVTSYFPAIGDSLAASLHTSSRTGIALFIGLLVAFYGARGIADSVQNALHVLWAVPRKKRTGFPLSMLRSFGIIIFAGLGLVVSAILSGYAANTSYSFFLRIIIGTASFIVLFAVFWGIFTYGSSAKKRPIANIPGALFAAVLLQFLQAIGTYLITSQLHRHSGLNAQFGIVLVLLFWIYLQAQVFIFALEYNTVRAHRLYPRAIDDKNPTDADKTAHRLYAARDSYISEEQ
jgi:inner membrane protein YhjD